MKILLKKVGISTYNPETKEISNFWMICNLQNGKEIEIFDNVPYDLRNFEKKEIDGLIFMSLSSNPIDDSMMSDSNTIIFKGVYIGKYIIPVKWKIPEYIKLKYNHIIEFHAIETENGIFIINPSRLKYYSIKEGNEFMFRANSFELWAWQPIKK